MGTSVLVRIHSVPVPDPVIAIALRSTPPGHPMPLAILEAPSGRLAVSLSPKIVALATVLYDWRPPYTARTKMLI
jgi:hypothetical protein